MCLWVPLLSVDEVGELKEKNECEYIQVSLNSMQPNEETYMDGVTDEEDGRVVSDTVPVAFLCVEFDSEATRVTCSVCTTRLTT